MIEFLKNPFVIPVYSALVAVLITFAAQGIWERHKQSDARGHALSVLHQELKHHIQMFADLNGRLEKKDRYVHPTIDPYAVKNFLGSNFVKPSQDADLIIKLHVHLQNLSSLNRAFNRIDDAASGWTSVHVEKLEGLQSSIQQNLEGMTSDLQACLDELATKV